MVLQLVFYLISLLRVASSSSNNEAVDYYVNLINEEIARTDTYSPPLDSTAFKPTSNQTTDYGTFDYIIVGAGSAGAVVANRLSEDNSSKVLLLEAGGHESNFSDIPAMMKHVRALEFNWNYNSTTQTTACLGELNSQCGYHRGKGLGGSSIINALMYVRGNKRDYDNWARQGNRGWSYKDVLPYYKMSEDSHVGGDEGYHGKGGYLNVEYHKPYSPQFDAFIDGNIELGRKVVDYNGKEQLGVGRTQLNNINGRRHSTGHAFLRPIMNRPNLKILTHSLTIKILINQLTKKAHGVLFSHGGKLLKAKTRKEIIISAGAFNSPQLLMLSGIGPREHLLHHGIPVIKSLSVGNNLQDHATYFGLNFQTNYSEPIKSLEQNVEEYLNGVGEFTIAGNSQGLGFFQTKLANITGYPDIELIINPSTNVYNTGTSPSRTFNIFVMLLHPKSHGTLKLKSKSPYDYPLIDLNYLSDPGDEDIETMYEGIQLALGVINTNVFKKLNTTLVYGPLPACQHLEYLSREFWYCQIRQQTAPIYHAVGTCKMGPNPLKGAVVDHKLRVHGIRNLRVADASIIPEVTSGHINAPAIMIGEKVADMINKGRW